MEGERALLVGDPAGIDFFEKASELDPSNSENFYRQGLALFEFGSVKGREKTLLLASKKFKMATRLSPQFFEAWHAWGNTLFLLERPQEAEEKLQQAVKNSLHQSPDLQAELFWDLGKVWIEIGHHSGEASDLQKGLDAFQKSCELDKSLPQEFWIDFALAYLEMSERINDTHQLIKAIHHLKHAVSLELSSFEGWMNLARSMGKLYTYVQDEAHFNGAHEYFSAAANLRPHNLETWHEWAFFLLKAGQQTSDTKKLRTCIEKCKRGSALNSQSPNLLAIWSEALATLGQMTDNIDLLHDAQNKIAEAHEFSEEGEIDVLHYEGKVLYYWGNYFNDFEYYYQAIEKFQEIISYDRTRFQDWFAIAKVYSKIGEIDDDIDAFEKALRFYAKAVDLRPSSLYYFEYGLTLSHLGEMKRDPEFLQQAITYFEYALQIQRKALYTHPGWLFHYAITLDLLGDLQEDESLYQKSFEIFSQVLMVDPDFPRIHYHLGLSFSHLGEALGEMDYFYRAVHHYRLAFKHAEEDDFIILDWGITLIHIAQHTFDKDIADVCYRESEIKLLQAARLGSEQSFYQLGCLYSLLKNYDKALYFLQKSHEAKSLPPLEELLDDEWLDGLRLTPSFQEFLALLS